MKKIIAVVLTFVMLTCTFAIMSNSGVEAKTKSGYYFAMIQKKKSYFGYIKKAKIVADKKVVKVNSKLKDEGETTEQPTTVAPTVQPTTQAPTEQQTKIVYGKTAKIITYGTFSYRKTDKGASKTLKAKKRTFVITKKCKFYDRCWEGKKPKKISRSKAFAKFKKIKKTSLNECEFKVKNGKVVQIKFGRG
ncbi:MAG: hypothetical protein K6E58_02765 [Eubacterium sp.]|nr:hypothetical protein [Eubacterium sp.]